MRHSRGVFVVPAAAAAAAAVATVAAAGLLPCGPGHRGQLAGPGAPWKQISWMIDQQAILAMA